MFPEEPHQLFRNTKFVHHTNGEYYRKLSGEVVEGMVWVQRLWHCLTASHLSFHPSGHDPVAAAVVFPVHNTPAVTVL